MASELGWIDISPKDRNRVKRFMDLMGMSGVMDELGVGNAVIFEELVFFG